MGRCWIVKEHAGQHGLEKALKFQMPRLGGSRHGKFRGLQVHGTCIVNISMAAAVDLRQEGDP